MKKTFLNSFNYNHWANEKIISYFLDTKNLPEKCLDLFSHIISVQDYWYDRLVNKNIYLIDLWDRYSLLELTPLNRNSTNTWKDFIKKSSKKSFRNLCGYYDKKGKPVDISVADIIHHLLNHSAYHRGQINLILRENNLEPIDIEFNNYAAF